MARQLRDGQRRRSHCKASNVDLRRTAYRARGARIGGSEDHAVPQIRNRAAKAVTAAVAQDVGLVGFSLAPEDRPSAVAPPEGHVAVRHDAAPAQARAAHSAAVRPAVENLAPVAAFRLRIRHRVNRAHKAAAFRVGHVRAGRHERDVFAAVAAEHVRARQVVEAGESAVRALPRVDVPGLRKEQMLAQGVENALKSSP